MVEERTAATSRSPLLLPPFLPLAALARARLVGARAMNNLAGLLAQRKAFVDSTAETSSGQGASDPAAAESAAKNRFGGGGGGVSSGQFTDKSATGAVGLVNAGATCYLNSLVQALYAIPEVRRRRDQSCVFSFENSRTKDMAEDGWASSSLIGFRHGLTMIASLFAERDEPPDRPRTPRSLPRSLVFPPASSGAPSTRGATTPRRPATRRRACRASFSGSSRCCRRAPPSSSTD